MGLFTQHTSEQLQMSAMLRAWVSWLRPLDIAFAEFLGYQAPDASPLLILAAALTSYQLGRGHTCLDLTALFANPVFTLALSYYDDRNLSLPQEFFATLNWNQWQEALNHPILIGTGAGNTPLVLQNSRLYLRRYWHYEQEVRTIINHRIKQTLILPIPETRAILDRLFPASEAKPDWQKIACVIAARNGFNVITGGPGTGKTTTVVRLLALLQELAIKINGRALEIRLATPTGKAATRLNSAITNALGELQLDSHVRATIPTKVTTLHSLLGRKAHTRHFSYRKGHPLELDVLIIDEASMIDLEMMAAICVALPKNAQLILIGDKDQLAAVEPGAVFGELGKNATLINYTPETANWVKEITGEQIDPIMISPQALSSDQSIIMLRHNYRFSAGIGHFAQLVNSGNINAREIIEKQNYPDVAFREITDVNQASFSNLIIDGMCKSQQRIEFGYRHYLEVMLKNKPNSRVGRDAFDHWARLVLQAYSKFQVLCAVRQGEWGVEALNQKIANLLLENKLIEMKKNSIWYLGRPILVTHNDYDLGIMNGDIGITLQLPDKNHELVYRVVFLDTNDQSIKWILPVRLQAVETVFALTVHKAQGSEFNHVALVLPNTMSPILTRELLYTGITRARNSLALINPAGSAFFAQIIQLIIF